MKPIYEIMNETPFIWVGISVFFMIFEVIIGSFFLIWLGTGAVLVAILKWLIPSLLWQHQFIIFSFISVLSIVIWRKYFNQNHKSESDKL